MLVLSCPDALVSSPSSAAWDRNVFSFDGSDFVEQEVKFNNDPESDISVQYSPRGIESVGLAGVLDSVDVSNAVPLQNGTGGVYGLCDFNGETRAIFKPADEENSTTNGDGYLKEYAAFVLDNGLAGVPETDIAVVKAGKRRQIGSVQRFVENSEDAENFGSGVFTVDDVHRIGVLDIRILNCDRHSGNMMRGIKSGKLVPIDHGTSFPNACNLNELSKVSLEWLMYPQAKKPFSAELLQEIQDINIEDNLDTLAAIGLDEGVQISVWMSTTLLKIGAKHGKTLYEIGSLIQRKGDRSEMSDLESLLVKASEASVAKDGSDFFTLFYNFATELLK
uniref:PI3K/PI4K catalytic domain-containing protein n=2 Tax=Mucochytrium quahogii TaxID=96639 RepID=A0A7S2W994_9STRA|mmetsp:Transcript_5436/g.8418  ORF Transcript_5436/g.8418 Transcript_5436/m.8418 type:complete len:335 (-) Transcript_5436:114-1118(-)|eukprot:CAMPEP_0203746870 /NCGR_PEP_ID=MMETSP0098-20131031/2183_1 /ASSEMBLY_ACC=CAM_ASM_000208 /TAXON_ID=96639 /ORGANISM=" , Strain NY0313808BC1" /LENGTH=334 /DNA_ID=CAMNT_0050635123 /DNA_START=650 /DNA_END=1654 /DNA_ORIENTATION=-